MSIEISEEVEIFAMLTDMEDDDTKEINEVIATISHTGLAIELAGTWLWITGDTKAHKELLKACGCKWAPKKSCWYFRPTSSKSRFYRGKKSLDEIRTTYAAKRVA